MSLQGASAAKSPSILWHFCCLLKPEGNRLGENKTDGNKLGAPSSPITSAPCCASTPLFSEESYRPPPFLLSSKTGPGLFNAQIVTKPLHFFYSAAFSYSLLRNPWNLLNFGVCPSPLPAPGSSGWPCQLSCAVLGVSAGSRPVLR